MFVSQNPVTRYFSLLVHLRLIEFRLHRPVWQVICSLQTRGRAQNKIYNFCPEGKKERGQVLGAGGGGGGEMFWSVSGRERV